MKIPEKTMFNPGLTHITTEDSSNINIKNKTPVITSEIYLFIIIFLYK